MVGVIATLTVPVVVNNVQQNRRQVVFKETINTLMQAIKQGVDLGEIYSPQTTQSFLAKRLSVKHYQTTACSEGASYAATDDCFIFNNGAVVHVADGSDFLYIDWNGAGPPNASDWYTVVNPETQDRINMNWNYTTETGWAHTPSGARDNTHAPRPGELVPSWLGDIAVFENIFTR